MGNNPFIKVEATQFTEIGYHGKDVESIITELTGLTIRKYREGINDISDGLAEEVNARFQEFLEIFFEIVNFRTSCFVIFRA
jgi:ATP-dependent protease HslVU (ClpYQ) ATPase subunit